MPDDWRPSGPWMKQFREALDDTFDEPSMELLTSDYFPARDTFSKISPPGFGKTFQFRLHELINQARIGGWLPDLVAAARERRQQTRPSAGSPRNWASPSPGPGWTTRRGGRWRR